MEPERHRKYGTWLFLNHRKEEGVAVVKEAISLEPQKTEAYINLMVLHGLSDEAIRSAMPNLFAPLFVFGKYMDDIDKHEVALRTFRESLQLMSKEGKIHPGNYSLCE